MPRVNVWIPDSLYTQAKEAGINVSAAAQYGISVKLGNAETIRAAARQPDGTDQSRSQALQEIATGLDVPAEALAADVGINHCAAATTCLHPAKERTSYGICRLCRQKVKR